VLDTLFLVKYVELALNVKKDASVVLFIEANINGPLAPATVIGQGPEIKGLDVTAAVIGRLTLATLAPFVVVVPKVKEAATCTVLPIWTYLASQTPLPLAQVLDNVGAQDCQASKPVPTLVSIALPNVRIARAPSLTRSVSSGVSQPLFVVVSI
jgi:hypothetical protein